MRGNCPLVINGFYNFFQELLPFVASITKTWTFNVFLYLIRDNLECFEVVAFNDIIKMYVNVKLILNIAKQNIEWGEGENICLY